MRCEERIFRIGRKHVQVTAWIYKTKKALYRVAKRNDVEAICCKCKGNDSMIVITDGGLTDGTAIHETQHVVQNAGKLSTEQQAELSEECSMWLIGLDAT